MATNPHKNPEVYSQLIVDAVLSPGVVTLSGYAVEHEWEVQKPKGTTGSTTLNRGRKNGGFTASFYLADDADFDAWEGFQRQLLASVEGPKPKALFISHPELFRNKVIDFVLTSIGDMQYDGKGGATVVCKFIDYRPPKPKPAAKAEAGKAPSAKAPDPNAKRKAELAALLEQAKHL